MSITLHYIKDFKGGLRNNFKDHRARIEFRNYQRHIFIKYAVVRNKILPGRVGMEMNFCLHAAL